MESTGIDGDRWEVRRFSNMRCTPMHEREKNGRQRPVNKGWA